MSDEDKEVHTFYKVISSKVDWSSNSLISSLQIFEI